ncbi:metallophosphoesterase [Enterovibrio nigricans]|uniref:Calcineurin-like phosphoesterase n=1 Tax=Enterovibrio nigricans DSM 22720 TaxID=1121868 RepID=A0A1T4VMD6_9GAMM|nr:metallophosphoesterase [Enterovibrio nigricans]PKF49276.1 hypothetical protein AT251_20070 [Enterovibrio nigricans]SKA66055.1 Calcineurin-like phosphoesterase [Enterovibrio nigricans DSM 22720]
MLRLLHLSDIHFRTSDLESPDIDPNSHIRDLMMRDLKAVCTEHDKAIDAIMITGDIAYAAHPKEFEEAKMWLKELCDSTGCREERVYVVPGNHDVDRTKADNIAVKAFRHIIKNDNNPHARDSHVREFLSNEISGIPIVAPLKNYIDFSNSFDCGLTYDKPYWNQTIELSPRVDLYIRGITTALFSSSEDTHNSLIVDSRQFSFPNKPGELYISLMHHPYDWILDGDAKNDELDNFVQLQLFGHVHKAKVTLGENSLKICSVALHPDKTESRYEPGYALIDLQEGESDHKHTNVNVEVFMRLMTTNPPSFHFKGFFNGNSLKKTVQIPVKNISAANIVKSEQAITPNDTLLISSTSEQPNASPEVSKSVAFLFQELSGSSQRKILDEIGLLTDEEWKTRSGVELQVIAFHRASEQNRFDQLKHMIFAERKLND